MAGRKARSKGIRGELEACKALAEVWPGLKRIYGQARANSSSPDIDAPGCPVFIEVKRQESINVHAAMEQAVEACAQGAKESSGYVIGATPAVARIGYAALARPPVIIHKRNRGEWLVTVRVRDLARLYKHCNVCHGIQGVGRWPKPTVSE